MKRNLQFALLRASMRPLMRSSVMTAVMAFAVALPFSAAMAASYVAPVPHVVLVSDSNAAAMSQPHAGEVDPVVTGKTVDAGQRAEWEMKRKKFLECGLCGKEQAFPEDLAGEL